MKTILITALMLSLSVCAFATDFSTINEESIQAFLEILPQYKVIVEKYGADDDMEDIEAMKQGTKIMSEISAILDKYGISQTEFPAFMQKVTLGFASVQMENSGMENMPFGFGNMTNITDDEKNILKKYAEDIENMFAEE